MNRVNLGKTKTLETNIGVELLKVGTDQIDTEVQLENGITEMTETRTECRPIEARIDLQQTMIYQVTIQEVIEDVIEVTKTETEDR